MRIAVTGATGNVGSRVVPQLLAAPGVTSVVGIARRLPADRDQRVEWHALDIAADDLTTAVRGADVVVHLAWLLQPAHDPDEMRRVNVVGSQRVLDAVVREGVPALVHASSIGAYSPGPKAPVTEEHPTGGISSSTYSRHKAHVERMLDRLEAEHPERRVVRLRPGLVLQDSAASAVARYFLGPFLPHSLVRRSLVPVLPAPRGFAVQAVHTDDCASAYVLACTTPVTGAFNIAADPVLDLRTVAEVLSARPLALPPGLVRCAVSASWRLHLQPTDAGWVDISLRCPLLDTTRARTVLGWSPAVDAREALLEVVRGIGRGSGGATPVLRPRPRLLGRTAEVARGLLPGAGGTG
jgi:UDP-glucose 4-epimerase